MIHSVIIFFGFHRETCLKVPCSVDNCRNKRVRNGYETESASGIWRGDLIGNKVRNAKWGGINYLGFHTGRIFIIPKRIRRCTKCIQVMKLSGQRRSKLSTSPVLYIGIIFTESFILRSRVP